MSCRLFSHSPTNGHLRCFQSFANSNTTTLNRTWCTYCFLFVEVYFDEMDCWVKGKLTCCQVWGPHPNPRWYQFAVHQQHMREPVSALTLTEQLVKPYFHQSDRSEMLAQFSFNLHFSYYEKGWASIQIFKGALHFCPMNSPFLFHPVFYWLPSIQS